MELTDSNNRAELMGTLEGEPVFSHEIYGEAFYLLMLCVPRLSGAADHIRVIASERLLSCGDISDGENITVIGQFRSYNAVEGGTSKRVRARYLPRRGVHAGQSEHAVFKRLYLQGAGLPHYAVRARNLRYAAGGEPHL